MKITLENIEPNLNPSTEELAKVILTRVGLEPRKKGSTENMHKTLIELYERIKAANREKKPELAIMAVEEMGMYAGITRQTMYEYLKRWLHLNFIVKTSYIKNGKVIIGYKLNGNNLEGAFSKVIQQINNNLEITQKYIKELQRTVKNEKISESIQNIKPNKILKNEDKVELGDTKERELE